MTEQYLEDAEKGLEYSSPQGNVFTPYYRVIPLERKRKHKAFNFVDVEGTQAQDLGMASDSFKLKLYFVGSTHHTEAQEFLAALSEPGYGKLALPLDSKERVVLPINIKQEQDLVDSINRTSFEVQFLETLGTYSFEGPPYPGESEEDSTFAGKLSSVIAAAKQGFKNGLNTLGDKLAGVTGIKSLTSTLKTKLGFSGSLGDLINRTTAEIEGFRDLQTSLIKDFESVTSSLDSGASSFLETPLIIASQIQSALHLPNFALTENLITNYSSFIDSVTESPKSYGRNSNNTLHIQTIFGVSAVAALATKVYSADFTTRQEAIDALDEVREAHTNLVEYIEEQEKATEGLALTQRFSVAPELYVSLDALILRLTGGVENLAAGLKQTVTYTVTHPTTSINIAAKYYPTLFSSDSEAAIKLVEDLSSLQGKNLVLLERGDTFKVLI